MYTKVVDKDRSLIYYYLTHIYNQYTDYIYENEFRIMQMADFVIDTKTNQMVKCRHTLEYVLDNFKPEPIELEIEK